MWLIGVFAAVVVIVILLMIVIYAQGKEDAQRRAQGLPPIARHDIHDGDTRIVYTMSNTPEYRGPSLYERSKGGQRPFGENSRTRRSEREKARSDRFYY